MLPNKFKLYQKWYSFFLIVIIMMTGLQSCHKKPDVYLMACTLQTGTPGLQLMYSYNGYHWHAIDTMLLKPLVGKGQFINPSLVKGPDDTFHLVWASGPGNDKGFGYAHSIDLIQWSVQQHLIVLPPDTTAEAAVNPDLYYDKWTKVFTISWTVTGQPGPSEGSLYVTQTADFKHFKPVKRGYNPGYSIDGATVVGRSVNDFVLLFQDKSPAEMTLKAVFGSQPEGPYKWETGSFTGFNTFDPLVFKVGAKWFVFYRAAEAPAFRAVNTLDFSTYENCTKEISLPEGYHGGSVLKISGKEFLKLMRSLHKKPF